MKEAEPETQAEAEHPRSEGELTSARAVELQDLRFALSLLEEEREAKPTEESAPSTAGGASADDASPILLPPDMPIGEFLASLRVDLSSQYGAMLCSEGYDTLEACSFIDEDEFDRLAVLPGHRRVILASLSIWTAASGSGGGAIGGGLAQNSA